MPGPIIHKIAMKEAVKLINLTSNLNLNLKVGSYAENMEPDLVSSHGFDFETNQGSIFECVKQCYYDLESVHDISRSLRYMCHYIVDAHTIGQIVGKYHGKIDRRIDFFSAFVPHKNKYQPKIKNYTDSFEHVNHLLMWSAYSVYFQHNERAKDARFLFSRDLKHMIRNAIQKGAEFTYEYFNLARQKGWLNRL